MSRQSAILNGLDQTRAQVNAILDRVAANDWELPVQESDQLWTARQLLIHMADAQRGMTGQMKRIQAGEEAVPEGFDLNRWNKRQVEKGAERTIGDLRAQLESDRDALKAAITEMSEADLDKRGRHGSGAIMSIEEIATLIGTHELGHAEAIAAKIVAR